MYHDKLQLITRIANWITKDVDALQSDVALRDNEIKILKKINTYQATHISQLKHEKDQMQGTIRLLRQQRKEGRWLP